MVHARWRHLAAGELPGVSYVMPVLNEATHVRAAVKSLLAQEYDGPREVAIALGPSSDGTAEELARLHAEDPRVRVVDNPVGSTPNGLNAAIASTTYPVIIRVDAHSELSPEYTRVAVETMLRTGAANVGGVMEAVGRTPFERAVAHAYGSRFGLGGTKLHRGGDEGPSETVYLGCFDREQLAEAGGFDEYFKRAQDWELNKRLREAGKVVWFTPRMSVVYRPRSSVNRLARQFFSTGMWRGDIARKFPAANGVRYFVAPAVIGAVSVGGLVGTAGIVHSIAARRPSPGLLGWAVPAGYAAAMTGVAVAAAPEVGVGTAARLPVVLATMHTCWGGGFILSYLGIRRAGAQHNGR